MGRMLPRNPPWPIIAYIGAKQEYPRHSNITIAHLIQGIRFFATILLLRGLIIVSYTEYTSSQLARRGREFLRW